ncbi:MAG: hypothetical protein HYX43_05050 [Burkholderiales bacterium]|nr:hypothetical protein [Burkholderiales bacterium]
MTISKTFNEQNLNWIHDQVNERIPANFYSQALEAAPSRACQKCKPVQIAGQPAQPYVVVNLQVADVDRVEKTWQFQAIAERRFSHSLQAIYGPSATADDMEAVREFWRDHHHALDRSWYCVLTDRALLMVSSTNDLDHTSNDLPTYAQQAVDFIWAQTALLNEIDQDLDKLLKDELPRLMQISSTSAQKRAEDLGHFLTPLVEHRKRYLSTLFDPLLYAFPAGTTHSVAKAAREFFMTVEARERVLHKFEAVDRHVDDTLQLGALNLSKT